MPGLKRKPGLPELRPDGFGRAAFTTEPPTDAVSAIRFYRGRQKAPTKELVSIRLDRDIVSAYRKTGRGWQARINDTLRRAAKRLL
jgi:uncharacterized protein (DUF4415 family)